MDTSKPVQFNASAGSYFLVFIVVTISLYIPFFGWAFGFNYMADWVAKNAKVEGKPVAYKAGYGETLKFIFINSLLLFITLGIYIFWFAPKIYKYFADHVVYDNAPAAATAPVTAETPAVPSPAAETAPSAPAPESPAPESPSTDTPNNNPPAGLVQ